MFWNRRVRFLTCSRNGKCLWKMKAGTRWRFWKPTEVGNTHPHRVWDTSPICWGITSDSAKDPWAEQSGWTDVPDLDEICASMHAFTCQLASEYCAEAVYYLKNHSPTKQLKAWPPLKHGWRKGHSSHIYVSSDARPINMFQRTNEGSLTRQRSAFLWFYGEENGYSLLWPQQKEDLLQPRCDHQWEWVWYWAGCCTIGRRPLLGVGTLKRGQCFSWASGSWTCTCSPTSTTAKCSTVRKRAALSWHYGDRVYLRKCEPTTVDQILSPPHKDFWLEAMEKEMTSLQESNV